MKAGAIADALALLVVLFVTVAKCSLDALCQEILHPWDAGIPKISQSFRCVQASAFGRRPAFDEVDDVASVRVLVWP